MFRSLTALALPLALALPACRSPFAPSDETSKDEHTTEVGLGVHSWPIYERDVLTNGVRTDVLWPLSSIRTLDDGTVRRADILFPIGHWYRDEQKTRFGIRPLFDVENEETKDGHVSDWDVLWPLIGWRTAPKRTRSHVFPLWWQGSGVDWAYQVVFPVYWHGNTGDQRWFHLWPLYGQWGNETASTRYALWPLFWHSTDKSDERSEWTALAGLLEYGRSRDGASSRVVPIWWRERNGADVWSMLFPLWFQSRTASSRALFIGPFYGSIQATEFEKHFYGGPLFITSRKLDDSAHGFDVLWPLFHHERRTDGQTTRLFPLLWSKSKDDHGYFHLWPLFGRSWDSDATTTSVVWPFFQYERGGDGDYRLDAPWPLFKIERSEGSSETRLFPLFNHSSEADGSYETRIGLLFHVAAEADGGHESSLFPIYSASGRADGSYEGRIGILLANWDGDAKGQSTFHILWRLVQNDEIKVEDEGATHSLHVFAFNPFYRSERNDRGDSSWSVLFSLVKRTQRGDDVRWRWFWFFGDA